MITKQWILTYLVNDHLVQGFLLPAAVLQCWRIVMHKPHVQCTSVWCRNLLCRYQIHALIRT